MPKVRRVPARFLAAPRSKSRRSMLGAMATADPVAASQGAGGGSSRPPRLSLRKQLYPDVKNFKETVQLPTIVVPGGGGGAGGIINFKIADLTNWLHLSGLFDMFRINRVELKILPAFSESSTSDLDINGHLGQLPTFCLANNKNPTVPAPTSLADCLNDDGVKVTRLGPEILRWSISNPRPSLGTALIADYAQYDGMNPWLSTGGNGSVDQSTMLHFGVRWFGQSQASADTNLQVYATYYFSCKEQD